MNCWAIIVAGGKGSRLGSSQPKQYLLLGDKPILCWSAQALASSSLIQGLIIVVEESRTSEVNKLFQKWPLPKPYQICAGGAERSDSVRAGLKKLPDDAELVAIHDAARPLVSVDVIERVIKQAAQSGAAIPVLPVGDTIKEASGQQIISTVDRSLLRAAQTPQVFKVELLRRAFAALAAQTPVTDDAQVMELAGFEVSLVEGDKRNLKITLADDLAIAAAWLGLSTMKSMRTGHGYDVHRLVVGRPLILGGVNIPFSHGLLGHSDADVLTHAIGDALLGAAALGDLGKHFPDTAAEFRGVSSLKLLAQIRQLVVETSGHKIENIDSTIVAQQPKLAPFVDEMRAKIAHTLKVDLEQISIKATTTEGLGFTGDGQAMAAYAVATLTR